MPVRTLHDLDAVSQPCRYLVNRDPGRGQIGPERTTHIMEAGVDFASGEVTADSLAGVIPVLLSTLMVFR
jgi:hypothetical protein